MGFSCKQTHLIFYLEIGSGWPQNKDQPQRIDISQKAKKNKRKRKTQLSQTNKIPNCRNLACLSLSHLHFFFPPAFCTTCITCATSASLSCCQFYHHRHQNPATTKVGALCDLRLPKLKCNTTTTLSLSVCRSCQFLLFLFF